MHSPIVTLCLQYPYSPGNSGTIHSPLTSTALSYQLGDLSSVENGGLAALYSVASRCTRYYDLFDPESHYTSIKIVNGTVINVNSCKI